MNRNKVLGIVLMAMVAISVCGKANAQEGGKVINSAEELKAYLASQPDKGGANPIKVSMTINDPMLEKVAEVIGSAGRFVSLNITGNALTSIPDFAFEDLALASVTIPNSVTSIGEDAFYGCQLTSVIIPNSVTTIGSNAFNSNRLTSVTISNSVTRIGAGAFASNELTSVTIPNSVTIIEAGAFADNQLTSITIPNSVAKIESSVFIDNPLTSVTIGANVTLSTTRNPSFGDSGFDDTYNNGGKKAGTYTRPNASSTTWTKK